MLQQLKMFSISMCCCQGRVKDGVMEGQALHFRWGDGSKFVCQERENCLKDGRIVSSLGRFRSVNRGPKDESVKEKEFTDGWYVGQISRGKFRKGQGTFYFLNGDRYVGEWNRDNMHGSGTYHYKNGDRYEGPVDKGKFSGKGKFFFGSLDKYDGDFSDGNIKGRGKMTYRDGHIYTGNFKDWRQFGSGKMTFRNGDVVEGIWDGDKGKGSITYTDGSMYEVSNTIHCHHSSVLSRESSRRTRSMARAPTPTPMVTSTLGCTR